MAYPKISETDALGLIEIAGESINACLLAACVTPDDDLESRKNEGPFLKYTADLVKGIKNGTRNPGKQIAAILYCAKLMNRPLRQRARLVAKLDALGLTSDKQPAPTSPTDFATLHDAEEDAEVAFDKAQMWHSREPHSIAARVALWQAGERVIERTRAIMDAATASVYHDETVRRTARVNGGFAPRSAA